MSDFPGLLGVIHRLQQRIRMVEKAIPDAPRWGTVISVTPLKIQPDTGKETPFTNPVENFAGQLKVGDRVCHQLVGKKIFVWGQAGGPMTPDTSPLLEGNYGVVDSWRALPSGLYRQWNSSAAGMPGTYGFIEVSRFGTDGAATFRQQNNGRVFRFAWNISTTTVDWLADIQIDGPTISGSVNLNSYTNAGVFFQNSNADAAAGGNYPVPVAGMLEVFKRSADAGFVYQRYTAYRTYGGSHTYVRGFYDGGWSTWERLGSGAMGGVVAPNHTVANQTTATAISFPYARFQRTPSIVTTCWTSAPNTRHSTYAGPSTAGFTLYQWTQGTGAQSVSWQAIQY